MPNTENVSQPSAPKSAQEQSREQAATTQQLYFPFWNKPALNFRTGARYFGARRSGGRRQHAGVDLIAPFGTKIRAIADGVVVQSPYYFYEGTNALEIRHPGIGVVRYGEISIVKAVKLKAGEQVKAGQLIAYVGRLNSGSSMLHFELYSGASTSKGSLTVRGNPPYQRRKDLMNPTSLIEKLLKITFGN